MTLRALLFLACVSIGCAGPVDPLAGPDLPIPAPPTDPPGPLDPPTSHTRTAVVSLGFGDAPVEGFVYLLPGVEGAGSTYRVDLDEDGAFDREGTLSRGIGFRYAFQTPGVHHIRVEFSGPAGTETVDPVVVVNDPAAAQVLAQTQLPLTAAHAFEGVVMDPAGEHLYVGDFSDGSLLQLDPGDLEVLRTIDTMGRSIEGLAVDPAGGRLFAIFKDNLLATVAIPEMRLETRVETGHPNEFFIHAIDGTRVVTGGGGPFALHDALSGDLLAETVPPAGGFFRTWHFALAEGRSTAVVVGREALETHYSLFVVDLPSLAVMRKIRIPFFSAWIVALDPNEPRAYVLGNDARTARFLVVNLDTGDVLRDLPIGLSFCGFCAANPSAVAFGGRYVAMEWNGGAYLIDTELDLPVHRLGNYGFSNVGFSVAASPVEDGVFFFVESGGMIHKVKGR